MTLPTNSKQELKERLFDQFAANLAAVTPYLVDEAAPPDTYLCPLCHRLFGRECLGDPEALTVEHSIPGTIGGTYATAVLTCKPCNNGGGTRLDAHLRNKLAAEEFFQGLGGKTMRVRYGNGDEWVDADLKLPHGESRNIEIRCCKSMKDAPQMKRVIEATSQALQNPGAGMKIKMRFDYRPRNARLGLLRIAFLMMFRQFGYGYALSPGADRVRQQLLNPDETILDPTSAVAMDGIPAEHANTVAVVTRPAEHRAFLVLLRLKTKARVVHKAVYMPGVDDAEATIYRRLDQGRLAGETPRITYKSFGSDPGWTAGTDEVLLAWRVWAEAGEVEGSPV